MSALFATIQRHVINDVVSLLDAMLIKRVRIAIFIPNLISPYTFIRNILERKIKNICGDLAITPSINADDETRCHQFLSDAYPRIGKVERIKYVTPQGLRHVRSYNVS